MNSIIATVVGLPPDLRYAVGQWNATTHGNITFVVFLLVSRYLLVYVRERLQGSVDTTIHVFQNGLVPRYWSQKLLLWSTPRDGQQERVSDSGVIVAFVFLVWRGASNRSLDNKTHVPTSYHTKTCYKLQLSQSVRVGVVAIKDAPGGWGLHPSAATTVCMRV